MLSALRSYFHNLQSIFELENGKIDWPIYGQSAQEILDLASSLEILDGVRI